MVSVAPVVAQVVDVEGTVVVPLVEVLEATVTVVQYVVGAVTVVVAIVWLERQDVPEVVVAVDVLLSVKL